MVFDRIKNLPWKGIGMVGSGILMLAIAGYATYSSVNFARTALEISQNSDERTKRFNESYRRLLKIADTNKDGVTTEKEWIALYKKHGVQYDQGPANHRREDLEKITEGEEASN